MISITNTLPTRPAVKIIIDGLFMLCLEHNTDQATLGVYEHSTDHRFSIRISKKEYGSEDASKLGKGGDLVRNLDDQNEIQNGDISITIPGRGSNIQLYQHEDLLDSHISSSATDLSSEVSTNQKKYEPDFRWIMDLEGPRFYNTKLNIVPGVIHRVIRVNQGVFYTEDFISRTIRQAYPETGKIEGRTFPDRAYYVATKMAIAIDALLENESLDISYTEEDAQKRISLRQPGANSFYEVYASNNCSLSESSRRSLEDDLKRRHSDFQYYYNVIALPVVDRIDLDLFVQGAGSNKFPCDLVLLGKTPDFVGGE